MNTSNETLTVNREMSDYGEGNERTTIGVRQMTKQKLNENRAPGQCYDGFIRQLVALWEKTNGNGNR